MQYNADTSKKFHNRMTSIKDDNPRETETKEFIISTVCVIAVPTPRESQEEGRREWAVSSPHSVTTGDLNWKSFILHGNE